MGKHFKLILTVFVVISLSLAISFFAFSVGILDLKRFDSERIAMDQGNVYIGLQHETNPMTLDNSEDTLEGFKQIFNRLQTLPYTYYELYQQPLDCSLDQGEFFDAYFQEYSRGCQQTQCIQISTNIQSDFNLSLASGRLLCLEDYEHINGAFIPVLMGYDYSKLYKVGDTFSGNYLFSPFTFEIIGFLNEGSSVYSSTVCIDLDRCIIMPSFNFKETPKSDQEFITQKIHYANKTSGKLRISPNEFADAYNMVQDIIKSSTVGTYSVTSSSFGSISNEKGFSLNVWFVISGLCCLLFIYLSLFIENRILKKERFSIPLYKRILAALSIVLISFVVSSFFSKYLLARIGIFYHITLPLAIFSVFLVLLFSICSPIIQMRGQKNRIMKENF